MHVSLFDLENYDHDLNMFSATIRAWVIGSFQYLIHC